LRYYCNHHEQASAIAAEAYARLRGVSVCNVTTGPGGTNALTGVAGAWLDSIPMVVISGQVNRNNMIGKLPLRQLGSELNIVDIVKPITKYATLVDKPEKIRYHLEKAFYLATSGRPGPVWLDIPLDVQAAMIDDEKLIPFDEPEKEACYNEQLVKKQVKEVIKMLRKARRPVI